MKIPLGLLILLFAGSIDVGAVVRRDDRSDADYRNLGRQLAFGSVGRVEVNYGDGDGFIALGTATLFGRDRLVSAGHVFDSDALSGVQSVRINFGRGRVQKIDFQREGVVNVNRGYDSLTLRNDVSVVFLSQKFDIAPGKFYAGKKVSLDTPITFVGFGLTGTGSRGSFQFSSAKRGGENALGRYTRQGAGFEVDFDHPTNPRFNSLGSRNALPLEGLLGAGDSGGSAWVKVGKQWKLVGINSYGVDWYPNGSGNGVEDDYGDHSGFVYLPKYTGWINSLNNPLSAGSTQVGASALTAVPEPGTIALTVIGLGSLTLLRRRRR